MSKYPVEPGIQISLDGILWHPLTDHNRGEIQVSPQMIEKSARMANGSMRKYVVATKNTINTSWKMVPSRTSHTVDGGYSSEWLDAFYSANSFFPIYLKVVSASVSTPEKGHYPNESTRLSSDTSSKVYTVFITSYSSTTLRRSKILDYVDMEIEFTEI